VEETTFRSCWEGARIALEVGTRVQDQEEVMHQALFVSDFQLAFLAKKQKVETNSENQK
jgi:hypothetical protein